LVPIQIKPLVAIFKEVTKSLVKIFSFFGLLLKFKNSPVCGLYLFIPLGVPIHKF
jgi:hypothetical protein